MPSNKDSLIEKLLHKVKKSYILLFYGDKIIACMLYCDINSCLVKHELVIWG